MKGVWIIAVLALTACDAFRKDPFARQSDETFLTASVEAVRAFRDSVYGVELDKCSNCHGNGIGPQFVVSNLEEAYEYAKNYVNFSDVPSSRFVTRMMDGHCGPFCQSDGSEMIGAINSWWEDGESAVAGSVGGAINVTLSRIQIPLTLPTGNAFTTLTWPLSAVDGRFAGAQFQIDIQRFSEDAYRLRRPRLITAGNPILAADIKILLNGEYDPLNNGYTTVNVLVPANTSQILHQNTMILLEDNGPGDEISIGFEVLEVP